MAVVFITSYCLHKKDEVHVQVICSLTDYQKPVIIVIFFPQITANAVAADQNRKELVCVDVDIHL